MRLNKDKIQQRFARAAATYDNQAVVQLKVAARLLALLKEHILQPPGRILEIGCCTGLLTARLHRMFDGVSAFFVNDLVPDFQTRVAERLDYDPTLVFLSGDIEQLDIPKNLDLVVSSSTLHWLEDLPTLFKTIYNRLAPGGTLCFSIYGTRNLKELREVTGIGLEYYGLEELKTLVGHNFEILNSDEEEITLHFDDPQTLLNHLRETGVNALDTVPWTRSRLADFRQEYSARFGRKGQVALTYHPIYCIAQKKS